MGPSLPLSQDRWVQVFGDPLCLTALGLQQPVPPGPGPFLSPNYDALSTPSLTEAAPPSTLIALVPLPVGDRESCPQAGPRLAALAWGRSWGGVRAEYRDVGVAALSLVLAWGQDA